MIASSRPVRQERLMSTQMQSTIKHSNDDDYIVNMHALHNAQLLRETLPRCLTAPIPYTVDRKAKHDELAAKLRVSGLMKRAETAAKAKATREKNKKLKDPQVTQEVSIEGNAEV